MTSERLPYLYHDVRAAADEMPLQQTGHVSEPGKCGAAMPLPLASVESLALTSSTQKCMGGVSADGRWGWLTRGPVLEVVDMKNMTRIATRAPGDGVESNANIHCCTEVHNIAAEDGQNDGVLLALGLECGSSDGRVALFDPKRCVTIASLSIPERASCLAHIPSGSVSWVDAELCFPDGALLVGTVSGRVMLIDLRLSDILGKYEQNVFSGEHSFSSGPVRITVRMRGFGSDGRTSASVHAGIWLDPSVSSAVSSEYAKGQPSRNYSQITTVSPLSATNHIAVGHEDGAFYIWHWTGGAPALWDHQVALPEPVVQCHDVTCVGVVGFAYRLPCGDEYPLLVVAYNTFRNDASALAMGLVAVFQTHGQRSDGRHIEPATFKHFLGAAVPDPLAPSIASTVLSLRIADDRAGPAAAATGVWDESERFTPVEVVWVANYDVGVDGADDAFDDTSGLQQHCYVGLLDLDAKISVFEDTSEAFAPSTNRDSSYFGVYRLPIPGNGNDDAVAVRVDPTSLARFHIPGVAGAPRDHHPWDTSTATVHATSFDATVLSTAAAQHVRCECMQQQVLQAVTMATPEDLDHPKALFERCIKAGLIAPIAVAADDVARRRTLVLEVALAHNCAAPALAYLDAAAQRGDSVALDVVRTWVGDMFEALITGNSAGDHAAAAAGGAVTRDFSLPRDAHENDIEVHRMCMLGTLRAVHERLTSLAATVLHTTAQGRRSLEAMWHRMEREWLRSRVLDWMFTCTLLPTAREKLRVLIKDLSPLYDNLRSGRAAQRPHHPSRMDQPGQQRFLFEHLMATVGMVYPPASLTHLLKQLAVATAAASMTPSTAILQCQCCFLYFLHDVDRVLASDGFEDGSTLAYADQFADAFDLAPAVTRTVRMFWHVDHGLFEPDMATGDGVLLEYFLADTALIPHQDLLVLRALHEQGNSDMALALIQVKRPSFASVEDMQLHVEILVDRGHVSEAFHTARTQSETNVRAVLLAHLFELCVQQSHSAKGLLQLPLDASEERILLKVLERDVASSSAHETKVLYLVHRARYVEAIRAHRAFVAAQHQLTDDQRDRHDVLKSILAGLYTLLPKVQRKLADADGPTPRGVTHAPMQNFPPTPRTRGPTPMHLTSQIGSATWDSPVSAQASPSGAAAALSQSFVGPPVTPVRSRANGHNLVFATPVHGTHGGTGAADPTPYGDGMGMVPSVGGDTPEPLSPVTLAGSISADGQMTPPRSIMKKPHGERRREGGIRFAADVPDGNDANEMDTDGTTNDRDATDVPRITRKPMFAMDVSDDEGTSPAPRGRVLTHSTVPVNPDESTDEITLNIPEHLVVDAAETASGPSTASPAPVAEPTLLRRDNENLLTPPQLGRKKVAITVAPSPAAASASSAATPGTPAGEPAASPGAVPPAQPPGTPSTAKDAFALKHGSSTRPLHSSPLAAGGTPFTASTPSHTATSALRTRTPKSRLMSFERVGTQARLMQLQPSPARTRPVSTTATPPPPTRPSVVQLKPTPNSPHSPYQVQTATATSVPRGSGSAPRALALTPAAAGTPPIVPATPATPGDVDADGMDDAAADYESPAPPMPTRHTPRTRSASRRTSNTPDVGPHAAVTTVTPGPTTRQARTRTPAAHKVPTARRGRRTAATSGQQKLGKKAPAHGMSLRTRSSTRS
eukprot:m.1443529 g.1443529  ORF g.1443529 m.1443529 type:complete len:1663 (-) comp25102_c1_seq3:957-5945(-)